MKFRVLLVGGIVLAALLVGGGVKAYFGATQYRLNGAVYRVPHQYEFSRNFSVPWLEGVRGFGHEPQESVWLLLPAEEVAAAVPGYSSTFHGYATDVAADLVVQVLGGKEAQEFRADYRRMWGRLATEQLSGAQRRIEPTTGWVRTIWVGGDRGTPAEGHSLFYLTPARGQADLPPEWLPPSCQGSPDIQKQETYYCKYTIHRAGLTFSFTLQQENLSTANRIPDYVLARLADWRA